jgi:hypothetical protein
LVATIEAREKEKEREREKKREREKSVLSPLWTTGETAVGGFLEDFLARNISKQFL